jgi:hypothetical protein
MSDLITDNESLLELYTELKAAYWTAGSIADKDLINGVADAISDLITRINQGKIVSAEAAYADASLHIAATVQQLGVIKADINKIIKNLNQAGRVLAAIEKVLPLLA